MSRLLVFAFFGVLFINTSCERCMSCRYSYTETIIVETPSGEVEEVIEYNDLILLDADGEPFGQECLKREDYKGIDNPFTIENTYALEKETTNLDDFDFNCSEL